MRAAQLAPDDFEAAFNAATTLREIQQMELAEHFYRLTVRLRPNVSRIFLFLFYKVTLIITREENAHVSRLASERMSPMLTNDVDCTR